MNPLYNAGIALYSCAARLAAMNSAKVREMRRGQKAALDDIRAGRGRLAPDGYDLWVHAASLGEFEQARPMLERLLAARPEASVLLTFFSPSGYTVRHNFHPRVQVAYLPFDTPENAVALLDAARPRMAVFVKYEFWGNYLSELKRRDIPTYIISAIFRSGQRFFRPGGKMWRRVLGCFRHLYVQDENSRRLLEGIGLTNVTVAGDTRFDRVTDVRRTLKPQPLVEQFLGNSLKGKPVLLVGSSWSADENVYIPWLLAKKDVRAIIAPHEFDAARIEALRKRLGPETAVLSELKAGKTDGLDPARFLIVDCFGILSSIYAYADIACVGGGFGAGLHNINEAAAFATPVIYGPNNHKFKEAADLRELGGGFCVHSRAEFEDVASRLLSDGNFREKAGKTAGKYIADHIGATDIIMRDLFGL